MKQFASKQLQEVWGENFNLCFKELEQRPRRWKGFCGMYFEGDKLFWY